MVVEGNSNAGTFVAAEVAHSIRLMQYEACKLVATSRKTLHVHTSFLSVSLRWFMKVGHRGWFQHNPTKAETPFHCLAAASF